MPRFFFDTDDGTAAFRDAEGCDCESEKAARGVAVSLVGQYVASDAWSTDGGVVTVTVRDGPDMVVMTVQLVCQVEMAGTSVS